MSFEHTNNNTLLNDISEPPTERNMFIQSNYIIPNDEKIKFQNF